MIKVVAGCIVQNGKVLLCQRPEGKSCELLFEFPGGKVEEGETNEEALKREIMEELGVEIDVFEAITSVEHHYPQKTIHLTLYHAKISRGEPVNKEHESLCFCSVEELSNYLLCPADYAMLPEIEKFFRSKE